MNVDIFYPEYHFEGKFLQAKKNLHQYQQVHDQEDGMNPGKRRIGASGPDIVKAVTVFALPELAFNRNALPIFLPAPSFQPFHFSLVFGSHFWRTPQ